MVKDSRSIVVDVVTGIPEPSARVDRRSAGPHVIDVATLGDPPPPRAIAGRADDGRNGAGAPPIAVARAAVTAAGRGPVGPARSAAATARIVAYCLAVGFVVGALALAGTDGGRHTLDAAWRDGVQRVQTALAEGDVRAAADAWETAGRAAVRARTPEALLEVGRAALRVGEATGDRPTAVARARRTFLAALFQARERRDASGVAQAGEAFAALGDHEVAERAFTVAMALAGQDRDVVARERVALLWSRFDSARSRP